VLLNNSVMERMENGFVTSDFEGGVISYNEKARDMLKLGKNKNLFTLLFSDPGSPDIKSFSKPGSKIYFETVINDYVLAVSGSVMENIYSFDRLLVLIITDLSEKRAIEEQLRKKEHLALIGEMSAGIAHEIRNPLASISGSVQFLRKELTLDNEEYQNLMDIIVKESDRLSQSIEDFLDFTKTTPLEKTDMDPAALIEEVLDLIAHNNEGVTIVKKFSSGFVINADMKKIKQLLWNLINNAVKAVGGDGTIEINLYKKERDVFMTVADDGIGIEPSRIAKIFTPFYSKFTSGIGLGMALVKRIVDEHNFEIAIESQKNIGTEVTICFKAEK